MPKIRQQPDRDPVFDRLLRAYMSCFMGEDGKLVLNDLAAATSGSVFVPGDPYSTAYNSGKQDLYAYIKQQVEQSLKE